MMNKFNQSSTEIKAWSRMNRNIYSERNPHGRDGRIGVLVGRYGSEIWMKKTPFFFSFGSWENSPGALLSDSERNRGKERRRTDHAHQFEPPRHACNFFHAFLENIDVLCI
jgi:hypothetical protein